MKFRVMEKGKKVHPRNTGKFVKNTGRGTKLYYVLLLVYAPMPALDF